MANHIKKIGPALCKQRLNWKTLISQHHYHSLRCKPQLVPTAIEISIKATIRRPITYQQDVGVHNLHEISDLYRRDPSCANMQYNNHNILSAMTAFCQTDRPWWTARDDSGFLIGCVLATQVDDMCSRISNLHVIPEIKGYMANQIARTLYEKAADSVDVENRPIHLAAPIGCLSNTEIYNSQIRIDETKNLNARFGRPNLDHLDFLNQIIPDDGDAFQILPFNRNRDLDEIITWDRDMVHSVQRPNFWDIYLDPSVVTAYVAIDNVFMKLCGVGAIQKSFDDDCMIVGPLYAETDFLAQVLFRKLMTHYISGNQLMVSHYESNKLMNDMFEMMDLPIVASVVNCYTKKNIPDKFNTNHVYLNSSNGITVQ